MTTNFGNRLIEFGSALQGDPSLTMARRERERQEEQRRQLGGILAGESIPAFARVEQTPEQIRQAQMAQIGALGTPEALKIGAAISPAAVGAVDRAQLALKGREQTRKERETQLKEDVVGELFEMDPFQVSISSQATESTLGEEAPIAIEGLKQQRNRFASALIVPELKDVARARIADIDEQIKFQRTLQKEKRDQEKKLTPEQAAKVALVRTGLKELGYINSKLFDKEGDLDRRLVLSLRTNAPFTEGRTLRAKILNAINAQLRAESGAAVPEEEVDRAFQRFVPSALDNTETAKEKLKGLQELLQGTLETSKGPRLATDVPVIRTQSQFDKLPSGAIYIEDGQRFRKP